MTKNTLTKLIVITLVLISALSLLPTGAQAAKCFAQYEKCLNEARTSFFGAFIDGLDCELELAACIKQALAF